jgi:hypothetical protein
MFVPVYVSGRKIESTGDVFFENEQNEKRKGKTSLNPLSKKS